MEMDIDERRDRALFHSGYSTDARMPSTKGYAPEILPSLMQIYGDNQMWITSGWDVSHVEPP